MGLFARSGMGLYVPVKYRVVTFSAFIYSMVHTNIHIQPIYNYSNTHIVLGCVGIIVGEVGKTVYIFR